jgi:flagellar hook-basal body complex protein FliE
MAISAIGGMLTNVPATAATTATGAARPDPTAGARFTQALSRLIEDSEDSAREANSKVGAMLDGTGEVHDAMIAMQRADLSLQFTVQVRNRLMNAYQEIMRMPV